MTNPDQPGPAEPEKKTWIEPKLEVLPIDDTSVAPFLHELEGGTGSS